MKSIKNWRHFSKKKHTKKSTGSFMHRPLKKKFSVFYK